MGKAEGRVFIGTHGDGVLSSAGHATNTDWPGYIGVEVTGASGAGFRGGDWNYDADYARVSDRSYAAYTDTGRGNDYGWRGARLAPSW